jgi:hypothetical protein
MVIPRQAQLESLNGDVAGAGSSNDVVKLTGSGGVVNAQGVRISNLGDPVAATDATTKAYIDGYFFGTNPWHSRLEWHINALTGNDTNIGDAANPLASLAELIRRTGQNRILAFEGTSNVLSVYIESDLDESLRITGLLVQGSEVNRMQVVGVPTQIATGTIQTWVESSPGVEGVIADAAVADWTPYLGKMLRITSGAASGAFTFVAAAAEAGVAVGRVGNLVKFNINGFPVAAGAAAPGDTYEIVQNPTVRSADVEAYHDIEWHSGSDNVPALFIIWLNMIGPGQELNHVRGGSGARDASTNSVQFIGCHIDGEIDAPVGSGAKFVGCNWTSNLTFHGGTWGFRYQAGGAAVFVGSEIHATGVYQPGEGSFFSYIRLDASRAYGYLSFGVYGTIPPGNGAIFINNGSRIILRGNWGMVTPSGAFGIDCQAYVEIDTDKPTIAGTVDDVRIGANVMSWPDVPWKNTLPNQAQWVGGAAAPGTDSNDYHVIMKI